MLTETTLPLEPAEVEQLKLRIKKYKRSLVFVFLFLISTTLLLFFVIKFLPIAFFLCGVIALFIIFSIVFYRRMRGDLDSGTKRIVTGNITGKTFKHVGYKTYNIEINSEKKQIKVDLTKLTGSGKSLKTIYISYSSVNMHNHINRGAHFVFTLENSLEIKVSPLQFSQFSEGEKVKASLYSHTGDPIDIEKVNG